MKFLSPMIFAGAVALTALPVLAWAVIPSMGSLNLSIAGANSGLNQVTGSTCKKGCGGTGLIVTGNAAAFSNITVVGTSDKTSSTNVSLAISNTGLNKVTGGGSIGTGNALSGASVTVVNVHSSFHPVVR